MTGIATSQVRSAHILETTPGTTPATPAFNTLHAVAQMKAAAMPLDSASQISRGARFGQNVAGIDVTGTIAGPLVYGVTDNLFATLLQGTWQTNVLRDGKAETTVTVENMFPAGVGGTNTFLRYRGVQAIGGTLNLAARQPITYSFDLAGYQSDNTATAILSGATYVDPTDIDPLSSGVDVGTISMGSYTLDCIESCEISFDFANRNLQPRIASDFLCGITRGDFRPVITAKIWVEANFAAIYNAARSRHTSFSLSIPLGTVTLKKYTLVFPACRFGETEIDFSGADAFHTVQILPGFDTSSGAVLTMTRAVV